MILDEEQVFTNNQQKRDFGNQEDLQNAMDQNIQIQDKDLHDKVLFAIQGLGSVRTIKQNNKSIEAYIKGPHCQQSIKDLVKFIRSDVPDNPKVKLILTNYNIIETDLIELLLLQVEDKKLSFWLIALLALMTQKPSDQLTQEEKEKLYKSLREYKSSFVKHECLTILTVHIADYFKTQPQHRQKAHYQMLQFIIVLLRNLLQIPDSKHENESLHNHFLATLIREQMFNPLLYLIQNEKGGIMEKIQIALLEIFYYSFTCFNPELIYKINNEKNYLKLANQNKLNRGPVPIRHSRFMPNFVQLSDVGVKRIIHNLHQKKQPILNQRQAPKRTVELKKVQKIELDTFPDNFMQLQFQVFDNESRQTVTRKIGQLVSQLSQEFVQVELPQLSQLVFSQIYKQTSEVTSQNVIHYLLLCNWAIKMTRTKYLKEKAEAKNHVEADQVEFDLAQIAQIMQTAHFELIYKTLFRQATREKKTQFKVNIFNAALKLFENYLNVISDIYTSLRQSDRNNANILMGNMFRHDIARIFKIGFERITHEGILKTLISVCHKFYKQLSRYSNGKVLTIQTNRLLKRKNKKKIKGQDDNQEELRDFISEDEESDEDGSQSYHQGDEEKQKKEKVKKGKPQKQKQRQRIPQSDEPMFQERKFNQISEFAIIAEYDIINKYLLFLKDNRILQNSDEFNDSIFFYFQQICKLLKGQWLFYQAETLCIFQQILQQSHEFLKKNKKNADKIKLVRSICNDFIKLLKKNKLALVESLFNYCNLSLKQKIMKNYDEGGYEGGQQIEKNMFVDDQRDN